jgi:Kelch motif/Galactose oxidase, central domain
MERCFFLAAVMLPLFGSVPCFAQSSLTSPRSGHAATLLNNGKVLITGGVGQSGLPLSSAELYDPRTKTSTATGSMTMARVHHTSTLLADGTVLIAGGDQNGTPLNTAEIYNPATGGVTSTPQMHRPHTEFTATLLKNGQVLIVGGPVAELHDPGTGKFLGTNGAPVAARKGFSGNL